MSKFSNKKTDLIRKLYTFSFCCFFGESRNSRVSENLARFSQTGKIPNSSLFSKNVFLNFQNSDEQFVNTRFVDTFRLSPVVRKKIGQGFSEMLTLEKIHLTCEFLFYSFNLNFSCLEIRLQSRTVSKTVFELFPQCYTQQVFFVRFAVV